MSVEEIDLRYVSASCTSHPVIRLKSLLRSLMERNVASIRIIFRESDIPVGIMEFLLKSHGYIVIEEFKLEDGSIQVSARRSSWPSLCRRRLESYLDRMNNLAEKCILI